MKGSSNNLRIAYEMRKRIGMFLAAAMVAACACAGTWKDSATGYTWTYRSNGMMAENIV